MKGNNKGPSERKPEYVTRIFFSFSWASLRVRCCAKDKAGNRTDAGLALIRGSYDPQGSQVLTNKDPDN